MNFNYTNFVSKIRKAASSKNASKTVFDELRATLNDQRLLNEGLPIQDEDEILLFEDDTVSIWSCMFDPQFIMPAHEHKMEVHIGAVTGFEKNIMFEKNGNSLEHTETKIVSPGEILSIHEDAIHAVSARGEKHSHALHVYMGPLTKVKRDLFEWETGQAVTFSEENFESMKRSSKDYPSL
ncbi:MAG: hypothetical protein ABJO57_14670 [Lentilitoribacter sp.]